MFCIHLIIHSLYRFVKYFFQIFYKLRIISFFLPPLRGGEKLVSIFYKLRIISIFLPCSAGKKKRDLNCYFREWLCNEFFTVLTEFSTKQRAVRCKKGIFSPKMLKTCRSERAFNHFSTGFTVENVEYFGRFLTKCIKIRAEFHNPARYKKHFLSPARRGREN